jgi:hypothetical protein
LPDPPKGLACEHAGPAADVQDRVTCPDSSGVSNGLAQAPKIAGTKQDS